MGGCLGSEVEPSSELRKRKNLNVDEFDGPVKKRSCTDIQYLIFFIFFVIVWFGLVLYCVKHGDLRRIFVGYDDCGNICGIRNEVNYGKVLSLNNPLCTDTDMSQKPYMLLYPKNSTSAKRECVSDCATRGYRKFFQRCVPKDEHGIAALLDSNEVQDFFQKAADDISLCSWEIIYMCAFALVLSIFLIFLFRYFAGILVWFVLICVIIVCVGLSTYLWILWGKEKDSFANPAVTQNKTTTYFTYAVISTLATVIILLLIFGMRKSIHLVVHLFIESGKAVQSMPLIVVQPFVTFLAVVILLFVWVYFFLWIESSGEGQIKQTQYGPVNRITFKKDEVINFARGYNVLAGFWLIQFIIGCQHMIIAGAVATWFFTRKKQSLDSPIAKSYGYLFNFHLGTVALGSLLIAIVQVVRIIFKAIESTVKEPKNDFTKALYKGFSCCLYCLEKILVYLTRNAYIEVAIYGDGLCTSGKRAYQVLVSNSLKVMVINSVGDFVLFLGKALIVAGSVGLGCKLLETKEGLNYLAVPLTIIGVFAYFVSHAFMTAFEMMIDTIFICFCEDCDMNDGQERPYFMSKGLMEFVEESQKVLKVGDVAAEPRSQTTRWLED